VVQAAGAVVATELVMSRRYTVAFAADDSNECVARVASYLESVADVRRPAGWDSWPDMATAVAVEVADGRADFGVLMCWTGTGTAIAANKVKDVRAAQASEPWIAENARRWNDANVLTLSLKRTAPDTAVECVAAFLGVEGPDDDEVANIAKLAGT
jgi:ribose 5-phosphate isomerase B